jgi:hypothetical protein
MGRWLETYQSPEEVLMSKYVYLTRPVKLLTFVRIKSISMAIIAKYKTEIPDFDMDFETFVRELSTDAPVLSDSKPD